MFNTGCSFLNRALNIDLIQADDVFTTFLVSSFPAIQGRELISSNFWNWLESTVARNDPVTDLLETHTKQKHPSYQKAFK